MSASSRGRTISSGSPRSDSAAIANTSSAWSDPSWVATLMPPMLGGGRRGAARAASADGGGASAGAGAAAATGGAEALGAAGAAGRAAAAGRGGAGRRRRGARAVLGGHRGALGAVGRRAEDDAEADLVVVAAEHVGAVARAVHPGVDGLAGGGELALAPGQVLADHVVVAAGDVAGVEQARGQRLAVRGDVSEERLGDHAARVRRRGLGQVSVGAGGREPVRGALLVEEAERGVGDLGEVAGGGDDVGAGAVGGASGGGGTEAGEESKDGDGGEEREGDSGGHALCIDPRSGDVHPTPPDRVSRRPPGRPIG